MNRRRKKRKLRKELTEILEHTPNKRELRLYRDSGIIKEKELPKRVAPPDDRSFENLEPVQEITPIKETLWQKIKSFLHL